MMGILSAAFAPTGKKSSSIIDMVRDYLGDGYGGGRILSADEAIKVSVVYACTRVLAQGVAQVPWQLMISEKTGRRRKFVEHPLYNLIAYKPNGWMTSFEYRETMVWHSVLTGNHYSFINKNYRGEILELIPLHPSCVEVVQNPDYTMSYNVRGKTGEMRILPEDMIWHVKGPSWNGYSGMDTIKLASEAIGLTLAAQDSASRMQRNGVKSSGVYSVEGELGEEGHKDLTRWIAENHSGPENVGKPLILDRGAKWHGTQMSGVDAQSMETRRFQIEEICRFMNVNPIMIFAESKNTTYASAEQMFLSHVVHTLAPWYQRIEQSADSKLISLEDRKKGVYSNFVEEGLLRGSIKDTKDTLLGYVNGGLMTPNEGRDKLDLDPIKDKFSDELRVPVYLVGEQGKEGKTDENA